MRNTLNRIVTITIICLSFLTYSCEEPTEELTEPVVDRTKAQVLDYLTNLSNETIEGVISGQNCYHGDEITSDSDLDGYNSMIADLHDSSGKWVGMIGLDYEYSKVFTTTELKSANEYLIDYWNNGGMVTINMSPQNPWVIDEEDISVNPGYYEGEGSTRDLDNMTSLDDLIDPEKEVYAAWIRKLDRLAVALQDLEDAGVVVLWRPMQEMNGSWFWWGMKSHTNDPDPYINLYRHMHDYFTNEKGLDNLLWVYSPNDSYDQDNNSSWNRTIDWAYPGDDYVDIVAGTVYDDDLDVADYEAYVALGKPIGLAEAGPSSAVDGDFDNTLYATKLKSDYPKIGYWVSWHSYPQYDSDCWGLLDNLYSTELLNNYPYVINRDDIVDQFTETETE